MKKILFISGSPRKGNTDFILEKIYQSTNCSKEFIYLRKKKLSNCIGCLSCDKTNKCVLGDDMQQIYPKLKKATTFVIGTPNYFDNVTGLFKAFIDRTNPFYETDILKGKKIINIVVGGGKIANSKRVIKEALSYFSSAHQLKTAGSFCFKGLNSRDIQNNKKSLEKINKIIKTVNSL